MASFSIPLSGLNASSEQLNAIANNLSNMDTVGYKATSTQFSDMLYQTLGSNGAGDPIQVGLGTTVSSNDANFTEGSPETTGVDTDAAIQGSGFFVLQDGDSQVYTRAGNFTISATGALQSADGLDVMGYTASADGTIDTSAPVSPIMINMGQTSPANATTSLQESLNLDADSTVTTPGTPPTGTPSWQTTVQVYDSLGGSHTATLSFWNTGDNTWAYSVSVPASDVSGATSAVTLTSGTLTFNSSGTLTGVTVDSADGGTGTVVDPTTGAAASVGNISGITLPSGDTMADGASALDFTWNLFSSGNSVVTQSASDFSGSGLQQNGYASGTLTSVSIQTNGVIDGVFSNGQTQAVGQLALASFANEEGLAAVGSNEFQQTQGSGAANIGIPGSGALGTLEGGELEQSNVDIATEFSNLILAQQAYGANARVLTTFDDISQDTIDLIQI